MITKLTNPSDKEYLDFALECNNNELRIEIDNSSGDRIVYGLREDQKLINGTIATRKDDLDYVNEVKRSKIVDLINYDKSICVNEFFINGSSTWLDKQSRLGLRMNISDAILKNELNVELLINDTVYIIQSAKLNDMLKEIEMYAKCCFLKTAFHKKNINSLSVASAIEAYDFKIEYPQKLSFNV